MQTKPLLCILMIVGAVISLPLQAKSCERKWAEYYAGKSWFEPWCDTATYKMRMPYNDEPDPAQVKEEYERQNRETPERLADRVTLSHPTYQIFEPCNPEVKFKEYTPVSCVDIFANITLTPPKSQYSDFDNEHKLNSVMLNCEIVYTIGQSGQKASIARHYVVSTGNFFSDYIDEKETRELQLYEAEFSVSQKYKRKFIQRAVNSPHTLNLRTQVTALNTVTCKPVYAK